MVTVGAPRTKQTFRSIWFCFHILLRRCKTSTPSTQRCYSPNASFSLLHHCTVPCKIVLASPTDPATCPNHFNLRFFTVVRQGIGPYDDILILSLTASLVMWSLYKMPSFMEHFALESASLHSIPRRNVVNSQTFYFSISETILKSF